MYLLSFDTKILRTKCEDNDGFSKITLRKNMAKEIIPYLEDDRRKHLVSYKMTCCSIDENNSGR